MNPMHPTLRTSLTLLVMLGGQLASACVGNAQVRKPKAAKAPAGIQIDLHLDFVPLFPGERCSGTLAREGFDFSGVLPVLPVAPDDVGPVRTITAYFPMLPGMLKLGPYLECRSPEGVLVEKTQRIITRADRKVYVSLSVPTPMAGLPAEVNEAMKPIITISTEGGDGHCVTTSSNGDKSRMPLGVAVGLSPDDESVTPAFAVSETDLKNGFDRTFTLSLGNLAHYICEPSASFRGTLRLRYAGGR